MNEEEKIQDNADDQPAIDGMIRELARSGENADMKFIKRVMAAIRCELPYPVSIQNVKDFWGCIFNTALRKAAAIAVLLATISVCTFSLYVFNSTADTAEIFLYSHKIFSPDQKLSFRIFVRDGETATPIKNRKVEIFLKDGKGTILETYKAVTDDNGIAVVEKAFPEISEGDYKLEAIVMNTRQKVDAERQISIRRTYKCMLSTDKPVYQPGQLINIRTLTMETSNIKPVAGKDVNIEIFDPKGNKVFRKEIKTSNFGIAATSFQLADQINTGDYSIKASVGNTVSERKVEVRKYVLPKFSISLKTDRGFYKPGEVIRGTVSLSYMFGKPVSGADITVTASDFTDKFNEFASIKGQSSNEGNFEFSIPLKDYFTGSMLENGDAFVKIDVSATDTGGHKELFSKKIVVSKDSFKVEFFPENGRIIQLPTNFYVFICSPDGKPVKTEINIERFGTVSTDENGIATFSAIPNTNDMRPAGKDDKPTVNNTFGPRSRSKPNTGIPCWSLSYTIKGTGNHEESDKKYFSLDSMPENFILRTDKAVYKVGETAKINIISYAESGIFFLDVVRNGVCILMKTVEVKNGVSECFIDIDDRLIGTLQIQAYRILPGGEIVSDIRLIQVNDPKSLNVTAQLDKDKYLPGENCTAKFAVEDNNGNPVVAALSLSVVDEAVFSLFQMHPGFEKMYFLLQEELLKPRYQVKAAPELFNERAESEIDYQRSAGMLLANDIKINKSEFTSGKSFSKRTREIDEWKQNYKEDLVTGILFALFGIFFMLIMPTVLLGMKRTVVPAENSFKFVKCNIVEWKHSLASITWKWAAYIPSLIFCFIILCIRRNITEAYYFLIVFLFIISLSPGIISLFIYRKSLEKFFGLSLKMDNSHKVLFPTIYAYPLFLVIMSSVAFFTVYFPDNKYYFEIYFLLVLSLGLIIYSAYACGLTTFTGGSMFVNCFSHRLPSRGLGLKMGDPSPLFIILGLFLFAPMFLIFMLAPLTVISMFMPLVKIIDTLGGPGGGEYSYSPPKCEEEQNFVDQDDSSSYEAFSMPRVRRYFPETLLWIPEIVTDENGKASVEIPLADSITAWRMSTGAVDKGGRLGCSEDKITVYKDFFVDIDLPVKLTQHDVVSIPVTVYNYLDDNQNVRLELANNESFRISDSLTKKLVLLPGEVKSVYFTVEVIRPGKHTLTVNAFGRSSSDAIKRQVEVEPDGVKIEKVINGSPGKGETLDKFEIPANAVDESAGTYLKIYPGTFSQIVEGIDSILRMPYGCFEQTSSITYPNVLALQYMKKTGQISPEIQMKALSLINTGYQRLLSFEISGGGFEWFGKSPANVALSAYGLMEFCDMRKVYENVDPKIIERTKQWLIEKRNFDGSWENKRWTLDLNSNVEVTAYILMALAESGIENSELESSFKYILKHIDDIKDSRTLAYCTVAFATAKRPEADNLMEKLYQMRNEEGDFVWWNNKNNNIYDTETTALAVQAMFRSGQHNATAAKALAWLIRNKDKDGNWVTTQSTIQSLRAIIAGSEQKPFDKAYDITISVNEKPVREISITKENYDVCQLVDLTEFVRKGVNTIEMKSPEGENFSYQIVYEYFIPKENISASSTETLKINLEYDKRNLAVNDILNCRVSVDNNGTETAPMVLLDIGVPPGFEVITDKLQGMKERNEIEQWEIRGQQVILYLREVKAQSQTVISFDMKAKFPIRARTPVSRAYEYYQPEIKSETVPVMIEVEEGKE